MIHYKNFNKKNETNNENAETTKTSQQQQLVKSIYQILINYHEMLKHKIAESGFKVCFCSHRNEKRCKCDYQNAIR